MKLNAKRNQKNPGLSPKVGPFIYMEPFVAAAVQDSPVYLNLDQSVEKACDLISQAARTGAKLIAFPETWLPGYPVWLDEAPKAALWDYGPAKALFAVLFENSITLPGPELIRIGKAAKAAGATVVMGAHERCRGTLYNTLFYVSHTGELAGIHRKIMPTYTERLIWGLGDGSTLTVIETPQGRVGGLICWEHWMPLLRAAMHEQTELVHIAQWPTIREMNQVASRQYAFEGQCFVVAAGSVLARRDAICTNKLKSELIERAQSLLDEMPGETDTLLMRGGSAIIAPDGSYLAGPLFDEPGILTAEINPSLATEGRLLLDSCGHYSRPDIFRLEVNTRPRENAVFRAE
jgi:predicted amidohydrolase